jgi:putative DNA primase/helicase
VTLHVTYLQDGRKLETHAPRKILSGMSGRTGCAVRLMPFESGALGIGEGIETMLSAWRLEGLPVWAAMNTSMLSKFEPPPDVSELVIYGDRDEGGLIAVAQLIERLQGRVRCRMRLPPLPHNDWNNVLTSGSFHE